MRNLCSWRGVALMAAAVMKVGLAAQAFPDLRPVEGTGAVRVYLLNAGAFSNSYLVIGSKRALVVDSGTGGGRLIEKARSLTGLPLVLVNTHGHPDHVGDSATFAEAYLHEADEGLAAGKAGKTRRIEDGARIDLGGVEFRAIGTPGHTAGSLCLYAAGPRLLFSGDSVSTESWLFLRESLPVATYRASLLRLRSMVAADAVVLPGHGAPLDAAFIGEQIACAERILAGAEGAERRTFAGAGRAFGLGRATIVFDPARLGD